MKSNQTRRRATVKRKKLELATLFHHYEVHNRSEGKSARTVEWYGQVLELFQKWMVSEGKSTFLEDIGENEVREFTLHLQGRRGLWGLASSHTVNNRVRALRAFFSWLHRQGYTEENKLKGVRPPKVQSKVIDILTDSEIADVFAALNTGALSGARSAAIFSLMLDTGLRLSEVVSLKFRDVHLEERYVKVLGKGNKERIVAFGLACHRSLIQYAYHFREESDEVEAEEFILCVDGYPMSSDGLRSLIERISQSSGVPRMHPHLLRHTYATRFLLNGGDVFLLKQNLGHTTLAMVEKYVHLASQMAAIASQEFSPLDRFEYPRGRRTGSKRVSVGSTARGGPQAAATLQNNGAKGVRPGMEGKSATSNWVRRPSKGG